MVGQPFRSCLAPGCPGSILRTRYARGKPWPLSDPLSTPLRFLFWTRTCGPPRPVFSSISLYPSFFGTALRLSSKLDYIADARFGTPSSYRTYIYLTTSSYGLASLGYIKLPELPVGENPSVFQTYSEYMGPPYPIYCRLFGALGPS